jgi:hypothetical protein
MEMAARCVQRLGESRRLTLRLGTAAYLGPRDADVWTGRKKWYRLAGEISRYFKRGQDFELVRYHFS